MGVLTVFYVQSGDWYLRGQVWTGALERATLYASVAEAKAALDTARWFMKHAAYKAARIIQK